MTTRDETQLQADIDLVRRVLVGDRQAVPELAERLDCVPRILQLRNGKAGRPLDDHELADLAQDVLLIVWRKLKGFEGHTVLPAWAYVICVFEFKNALRKKSRTPRPVGSGLEAESEAALGAKTWEPADPWEFEDVHLGLRRIGKEEASVIRLKHFRGSTFDEIARCLDLSLSTVKDRYYRGIAELRRILDEHRNES